MIKKDSTRNNNSQVDFEPKKLVSNWKFVGEQLNLLAGNSILTNSVCSGK